MGVVNFIDNFLKRALLLGTCDTCSCAPFLGYVTLEVSRGVEAKSSLTVFGAYVGLDEAVLEAGPQDSGLWRGNRRRIYSASVEYLAEKNAGFVSD